MCTLVRRSAAALFVVLLLPATLFAQAAITGVVKDPSGAVLPGVTVEAASPVLIEKVRSVVTDDTGQYRIVDLRPGTYTVRFILTGFSTVKREGIELSGTFVASINADLRVGALQETVTVTGETPIVDVQSAKVQNTVGKDILTAIPSSRNATGLQALIPGMATTGDSGGITGGTGGGASSMHGGRPSDSRTLADGLNMGWAGANSNAAVVNVAGARSRHQHLGVGKRNRRRRMNIVPRDGGASSTAPSMLRRKRRHRQQLHAGVEGRRPGRRPSCSRSPVQPDGRRTVRPRPPVVLPDLSRVVCREHDPRHGSTRTRATRRSGRSTSISPDRRSTTTARGTTSAA
jgi:hypothetical protein